METFSVIIPVYNEEDILVGNVEKLMDFLGKGDYRYEIIISDNGSTDRTAELGRHMERKYPRKVRFMSVPKRGVGAAFRNAVLNSSNEKLVSLDADLSVGMKFIPDCLKELDGNSIVIGTKFHSQDRTVFRKVLSKAYISMVNGLLGMNFSDYSIGAKGFRKSDIVGYLDNLDKDSFYIIELIHLANKDGKSIAEVDVTCNDIRKSKFNIFGESIYRLKKLLSLRFG